MKTQQISNMNINILLEYFQSFIMIHYDTYFIMIQRSSNFILYNKLH